MATPKLCKKCMAEMLKSIELNVDIVSETEATRQFAIRAWFAKWFFRFGAFILGSEIRFNRTWSVHNGGE